MGWEPPFLTSLAGNCYLPPVPFVRGWRTVKRGSPARSGGDLPCSWAGSRPRGFPSPHSAGFVLSEGPAAPAELPPGLWGTRCLGAANFVLKSPCHLQCPGWLSALEPAPMSGVFRGTRTPCALACGLCQAPGRQGQPRRPASHRERVPSSRGRGAQGPRRAGKNGAWELDQLLGATKISL